MSIALKEFGDSSFHPEGLGRELRDMVRNNASFLANMRFLPGVVLRWAELSVPQAADRVKEIQDRHADPNHPLLAYVLVDQLGDVQGVATAQSGLELNRLRRPFPPRIAKAAGPLGRLILDKANHPGGVNVSAWVDKDRSALLRDAYWHIANMASVELNGSPWTIEPVRSPNTIHQSIMYAGGTIKGTGYYDDLEATKWHAPPRACYYSLATAMDDFEQLLVPYET